MTKWRVQWGRVVIWIVIALAAVYGLVVGIGGLQRQTGMRRVEQMVNILNYPVDAVIVQGYQCWDIFPSRCGSLIFLQTDESVAEVHARLGGVAQVKSPATIDGYALFSRLGTLEDHQMRVDGIDPVANRLLMQAPDAFEWRWQDEEEQTWLAQFYQLKISERLYEVDGRLLEGNLLMLMWFAK